MEILEIEADLIVHTKAKVRSDPFSTSSFARHMSLTPWTNARTLFAKMAERAEADTSYLRVLIAWSIGGTIELREAAKPFGDYWSDLQFANAVDGLDAHHCHYTA